MLNELATAFALILVIEGVLYALFPVGMKRLLVSLIDVPPGLLRNAGLFAAIVGVAFVWLIKG